VDADFFASSTPIAESDVSGEIVVESGHPAKPRSINRYESAVADEVSRSDIENHNASELK
jgi:hypothetical protein